MDEQVEELAKELWKAKYPRFVLPNFWERIEESERQEWRKIAQVAINYLS